MNKHSGHNHNQSEAPGGASRWEFVSPCVHSYEEQKKLRVICSSETLGHEHDLEFGMDTFGSAKFRQYAELRISAACDLALPTAASRRVPSYFPGHTIPGPGGPNCQDVYRGALLYEQWVRAFDFDAGQPEFGTKQGSEQNIEWPSVRVQLRPQAEVDNSWHWRFLQRPALSFVTVDFAQDVAPERRANLRQEYELWLRKQIRLPLSTRSALAGALTTIHKAWTDTPPPSYSGEALQLAYELYVQFFPRLNGRNLLAVLFELEAICSYQTYTRPLRVFARGLFETNWLEIGYTKLESIRPTECCVNERLLDEVCNLANQRFAPIVINEYSSVADGNHRLTSAWMWNLLKFIANQTWSLNNEGLQRAVVAFMETFQPNDITKHELLHHLGVFLSNPEQRSRLVKLVKPWLSQYGFIDVVPVALLPEYISTTVSKESYDRGEAVRRVPPSIYRVMDENSSAVLPPRASYHFTDSALLPWFSVLTRSAHRAAKSRSKILY